MSSKSKVLAYLFLSAAITSCSTTNLARDKASTSAFCEGGRAKQQQVFVVATYHRIPKGTPIGYVKRIVESSASTSNFIRDHFIQSLLVYAYTDDPAKPLVRNEVLYKVFQDRFVHGYAPVLPHLVWVKENKFAICEDANCDGMNFPESASELVQFDSQKWDDGRCHDFFMEDGYVSGWGCHGNAFSLLNYMKNSGFNDGWLIANSYFLVPDSQKANLCTSAGLDRDCFNIFNSKDEFYKFREMISRNPSAQADFAYFKSFSGGLEDDTSMMEAKSAFSKDLAIKAGTKISTKVANDWTIYRITWDPTPLCQNARPISDFYTH